MANNFQLSFRPVSCGVAAFMSALLLLLPSSRGAVAANGAFENGKILYQQKQYARAAASFAEAVKSEPRNVSAFFYEANSLYALGKRAEAATWYQAILQRFPDSPQCATALTYLKSIDPAAASSFSRESSANSKSPSKPAAEGQSVSKSSTKASDDDFDVMSMVVVVRPQGQHPYCTKAFIESVKGALKQMPQNVVAYCARQGAKIYITPTLVDYRPELLNTRPRGYEQGHTYKNVPAMYDGEGVVVCQYALKGEDGSVWEPTDDPIGALRHEFGHCLDHHLGPAIPQPVK